MFMSCKNISEVLTYLRGHNVEYFNVCSRSNGVGVVVYNVVTKDPWTGEEISTSDSVRYDLSTGDIYKC